MVVTIAIFFFVVWMTNLYNFMDGSDGLAGGMALFGFASYGIAAWLEQEYVLASANFTIVAASLSFLLFNFHPAKIFMGDAGSIPLGFFAAAMGLWGWQLGCWAAWFPLLVFSPFIVDASVTLFKRALRGSRITEAHRDHYYQRAIQLGAGHRNVALFEYALMLMCGVLALWCREQSFPWVTLLWCVSLYALCMYLVDARWNKKQREAV
jgi:UDP-N-acetylmuramyl pentapeptide phosphotransferase/UDP-N-acetylglucosamine-1-phosphate transferase